MSFEKIILIGKSAFNSRMEQWASYVKNEVEYVNSKDKDPNLFDLADAVIIFHENHNISKDDEEIFADFVSQNKTGHKIDINGTFSATKSNFIMWLERNKPKTLLILGEESVAKNQRFEKFLNDLVLA
ncbi:MAG: hypothetical protein JJT77_05410 [Crocinitomicaceae bacterium]|nr:hypothetical protein [Crocinitomicaceae bacterium]